MVTSNPPVGSKRGELVEVKTHKSVGTPIPDGWVPLEVLTLTCPHWAYSNSAITVQIFLPWHLFPKSFLLWWVVILCDFCLSASHIWVTLVCSMTQILLELLIFLVLRIDLQFPSSFLAKPETGSPTTFLKKESFMTIQHGHPHNQSESGPFSCCYLKIWLRLMMLLPGMCDNLTSVRPRGSV